MAEREYEVAVTVDYAVTWEEISPGKMGWEAVAQGGSVGGMQLSRGALIMIFSSNRLGEMEDEFAAEYEGDA